MIFTDKAYIHIQREINRYIYHSVYTKFVCIVWCRAKGDTYITTNNTAAFTEPCLLWRYQDKCNRLFCLCLNANTGAVQILCSIIDIEKTESDCVVTWKRKEGKDNWVLCVLTLCQPRAAWLHVNCNVSDVAKNILELCSLFLLHCLKPVP